MQWHNYSQPSDVNGDQEVSPIDALVIINDLQSNGSRELPVSNGNLGEGESATMLIDVNGDNYATGLDALIVINEVNAEGEHGAAHNGPHADDPAYDPSSFHIHANLSIYVDSQLVTIPPDVGNPPTGGADIHTHDDTGQVHIHPQAARTEFVQLREFFDAWNANPATGSPSTVQLSDTQIFDNVVDNTNRLQMFVNGIEVAEEFEEYQIHDGDNIVLIYGSNPVISFNTNAGSIPLELLADEAPNTVDNFLRYVNGGVDGNGFTGTILHRSEQNFVIQGGGFVPTSLTTTDLAEIQNHIPSFSPIPDERGSGSMSNTFGTVAMAKNSFGATSEYFFNFGDNSFLDSQGFTVFAIALGMATPGGTRVANATINEIDSFTRVDVDPSNNGTSSFSVFDNVPFTAAGEMVAIESISGDGAVRGTVFADIDRDGVLDANEVGLQGHTVFSDTNGNGVLDSGEVSTTTDANGNYVLRLDAGQHTIRQRPTPSTLQTTPVNPSVFTLDVEIGREFTNVRFGVFEVSAPSLSGFVYFDRNNDGVRDPDEEGLAGVTIKLNGNDVLEGAVSVTTVTDSNGFYEFNRLTAGQYTLSQEQPSGVSDGIDTIGSQGGTVSENDEFTIALAEGVHGVENNFGELLGFAITGDVRSINGGAVGNVVLQIYAKDASGLRGEAPVATVLSRGGRFEVFGLPIGDYEIVVAAQPFLIPIESSISASVVDASSTDNVIALPGRAAAYISLLDISTLAAQALFSGEFVMAAADANGGGWYSAGSHYEDRFTDAHFTLVDDGAAVHVLVTTASGEMQSTTIPLDDPHVRVIGEESGMKLIAIYGANDTLGLQPVPHGSPEGEDPATPDAAAVDRVIQDLA